MNDVSSTTSLIEHAMLFWDFENISPPKDLSMRECVLCIRDATGVRGGECHVFCNVKTGISHQRRLECQRAGLVLVDVPSRKPNASDMQIQVAVMKHVFSKAPGSRGIVVLISGDSDFAELAATLRNRQFEFILVHNAQSNAQLLEAAARTFNFCEIVPTKSKTQPELHRCETCNKCFKSDRSLQQHCRMKNHSHCCDVASELQHASIVCDHCTAEFPSKKRLMRHLDSIDLIALLQASLGERLFVLDSNLKQAADLLQMKLSLGIVREKPQSLPREARLQLMLDCFCEYQKRIAKFLSLAAWLVLDPEDINFCSKSTHYEPECYRDEDWGEISPLIASCRNDDVEAVRYILKNFDNVNINATRSDGSAAIHIACSRGQHEIVELLLQHPKTDVNLMEEKVVFRTGLQKTPSFPILIAINRGHVKVVRELLKHKSFDRWVKTLDGWDYLSTAVERAFKNCASENSLVYSEILDVVLEGVTIEWWTSMPSCYSIPMIPECFRKVEPVTLELLLNRASEMDEKKKFSSSSCQIILYALNAIWGVDHYDFGDRYVAAKLKLTKKVLKHVKVAFSPTIDEHPWKRSLLFAAVETNDVEIVEKCLGFSETSRADAIGCSPLLVAAANSNVEIVRILLREGAFLQKSDVQLFVSHCKMRNICTWITVALETFRRACSLENVSLGALWERKTLDVLREATEDNSSCICF